MNTENEKDLLNSQQVNQSQTTQQTQGAKAHGEGNDLNSILNAFGLDRLDTIITHRSSDLALKDYQTKVITLVTKLVKKLDEYKAY
jgi:hypothetical protein